MTRIPGGAIHMTSRHIGLTVLPRLARTALGFGTGLALATLLAACAPKAPPAPPAGQVNAERLKAADTDTNRKLSKAEFFALMQQMQLNVRL